MSHRAIVMVAITVLASADASALTDEEIFRDFRFNLINPGARALGQGGAFISLADDATAAQANPSGLAYLLSPEYFAEFRAVDNAARSEILRGGHPGGRESFVATGTDLDDIRSSSFASAVVPFKQVTFGVSRQELLNSRNSTLNSFLLRFKIPPGTFSLQGSGSLDVSVTNYNFAAGYRISDSFSLGGSLTYSRLEVDARVKNFIVDTGGNLTGTPVLAPKLDLETSIDDSDSDAACSLGALYQGKRFGVGVVYRRAPKFRVKEHIDPGLDTFKVHDHLGREFDNLFHIPDSYGAGASWRPNDRFTLAGSIERTEFSDLLDGYVPGVNVLTGFDARFTVDDATDYRLGAEYVVSWRKLHLAPRAGVFTESDGTIRAVSTGTNSFASARSFPGSGREVHGTAGLGVDWPRFNIDLAADLAGSHNTYILSFRFLQAK